MSSLKSVVGNCLRHCPPLFRLGSNIYHKLNSSFKTLSPGTPEAIQKAFDLVSKEADGNIGDYYEFGLFRGYTFLQAYKHCEKQGIDDIHFYGFDSFEGLPEPANSIDEHGGRFFAGQFSCSLKEVEDNLSSRGMDISKATLIKGFYEESLTEDLRKQHTFGPASVVLMDCDYYSSTKTALDWMETYLQFGTVILFDDWYSYGDDNELGQQKAFAEFLKEHPQYEAEELWEFLNHGKGFILRQKK